MSGDRRLVGFHPVREALRHEPESLKRVLVDRRRGGQRQREIEALCREHGVHFEYVDESALSRFGVGVHNGFAAEAHAVDGSKALGAGDSDLVVLAEDIQDPRNLGALLRVCEGAGAGKVLLRDHGTAPLSESAVKSSAGASEWLAIERIGSSAQRLERLKEEGYWIYGLAAGGEAPWELDLSGRVVLCVGGEADGLRRLTRERCDKLVGLPMRGRIESLNLATAAAAVLYEAVRQRRQ